MLFYNYYQDAKCVTYQILSRVNIRNSPTNRKNTIKKKKFFDYNYVTVIVFLLSLKAQKLSSYRKGKSRNKRKTMDLRNTENKILSWKYSLRLREWEIYFIAMFLCAPRESDFKRPWSQISHPWNIFKDTLSSANIRAQNYLRIYLNVYYRYRNRYRYLLHTHTQEELDRHGE